MGDSTFIRRVVLKNYKSIAACDVQLRPLNVLVGANGAGKSNFLGALRMVADALRGPLDQALLSHGSIANVVRRSADEPSSFGIRLEFVLDAGQELSRTGHYAFEVAKRGEGGYEVAIEECFLQDAEHRPLVWYRVERGEVKQASSLPMPPALPDRLYLVNAAGLSPFRPVYDALHRMSFYDLNPQRLWGVQPREPGELLTWDGSNIVSVIRRLREQEPHLEARIGEYLARIVPGVQGVRERWIADYGLLEFTQAGASEAMPLMTFPASSMSDGTLRALGVLVAAFQTRLSARPARLIGIEEPETGLHPFAVKVLLGALREVSAFGQIVVTSHSPELLDDKDISADELIAVAWEQGTTRFGPIEEAERSVLKDRLYTAGELLRTNQLRLSEEAPLLEPEQLQLFGSA